MRRDIRAILQDATSLGDVAGLADDADLHDCGLTSFELVSVLLEIEERFNIQIPEADMVRERFASVGAIAAMVSRLTQSRAA